MSTDSDVQRDVTDALRWEPSLVNHAIAVVVRDGIATLTGHVDSVADQWAAGHVAGDVGGVRAIVNDVRVEPATSVQRPDADLASRNEPAMHDDDGRPNRAAASRPTRVPAPAAAPVAPHRTEEVMGNEQRNMELMQTLDDAWNAQDMDVFRQRHRHDVVVTWPGKPPTHGIRDHEQESLDFFRAFPDQKLDNRPYRVFFASGDWTCSIARFRGTFAGPLKGADGKDVPPTGKKFDVQFCTVARWGEDGQIIEENLFYDLVSFMQQIGLA